MFDCYSVPYTSSKAIFQISPFFAKRTTRSLLTGLDSEHREEQELAGSPDNGDLKRAR